LNAHPNPQYLYPLSLNEVPLSIPPIMDSIFDYFQTKFDEDNAHYYLHLMAFQLFIVFEV
jgi:hypothetical protein